MYALRTRLNKAGVCAFYRGNYFKFAVAGKI